MFVERTVRCSFSSFVFPQVTNQRLNGQLQTNYDRRTESIRRLSSEVVFTWFRNTDSWTCPYLAATVVIPHLEACETSVCFLILFVLFLSLALQSDSRLALFGHLNYRINTSLIWAVSFSTHRKLKNKLMSNQQCLSTLFHLPSPFAYKKQSTMSFLHEEGLVAFHRKALIYLFPISVNKHPHRRLPVFTNINISSQQSTLHTSCLVR